MKLQPLADTPEAISFEQAIDYTEALLSRKDLTNTELEKEIAALIATENGARGFFVCYLTGEWEIADRPTEGVIQALRTMPTPASELLVKNLAMSTAMAIAHRRIENEIQAKGSDRVARRTAQLMKLMNLDEVKRIASLMHSSAEYGRGEYSSFLDKWDYDTEQRAAIAASLVSI